MEVRISDYVQNHQDCTSASKKQLRDVVSVIDLTTLSDTDTNEVVTDLCHKATTTLGNVAAVCVYPRFIPVVTDLLATSDIKRASVANFPTGNQSLDEIYQEIDQALLAGANEIDVVFPYAAYLKGERKQALQIVAQCRKACSHAALKVILEISEFTHLEQIYSLCQELIDLNVDFLKTSTGKSTHGATLEGAATMLLAIKESGTTTGFKASGGIKTYPQAMSYINLAKRIMGEEWVTAKHFRIGASSLLDELLNLANQAND